MSCVAATGCGQDPLAGMMQAWSKELIPASGPGVPKRIPARMQGEQSAEHFY